MKINEESSKLSKPERPTLEARLRRTIHIAPPFTFRSPNFCSLPGYPTRCDPMWSPSAVASVKASEKETVIGPVIGMAIGEDCGGITIVAYFSYQFLWGFIEIFMEDLYSNLFCWNSFTFLWMSCCCNRCQLYNWIETKLCRDQWLRMCPRVRSTRHSRINLAASHRFRLRWPYLGSVSVTAGVATPWFCYQITCPEKLV